MARRTNTYAIRLAVEGGGQVKAELVSVGQSGEQSLKRIETAGGRASGGLKGLDRQDRGQDRRWGRGAAGAALRRQGVRRRAADAGHGAAALPRSATPASASK